MKLPEHTDISDEIIAAIAERHGITSHPVTRLRDAGIFNAIYCLGNDFVLRVPRRSAFHERALYIESVAVPLARGVGVRTPALCVYDDSRTLLPVAYSIYERVHGETLEQLDLEPDDAAEVWRELGRDLARLHVGVQHDGPATELGACETLPDPRDQAEMLALVGSITAVEARWLTRWLERIASAALTPVERHFLHGDTQATNVMVCGPAHAYAAVIDWGGAGWGDPARDFGGIPLRAVPFLLEGHRSVAPLPADETAEARILWWHLQLALFVARRNPQPNHSWAERPLTTLLDIARFFLADPPSPWRELRPER